MTITRETKAKPTAVPTNETKAKTKADTKTKDTTKFRSFRVKTVVNKDGSESTVVEFHSAALRNFMRENTNIENIYDDFPVIDVYDLFNALDMIKMRSQRTNETALVAEFVKFIEQENTVLMGRTKNMLEAGRISFGMLKFLLAPGTEIEIHGEELSGGRVVDVEYGSSMFGQFIQIQYETVSTNGRSFIRARDSLRIPAFKGVRSIDNMPVRLISPERKAALSERGKTYAKVGIGSADMNYQGHMEVKKWWSWDQMRADGRIMADHATYGQFVNEYNDPEEDDLQIKEIDEASLWMTEPYIKGFSFATKQWGRFALSRISDIEFRDEAFDQLVLAEDKKELVRALVTNGTGGFEDIISGKGGGCIFLLHGEPGVGKTLTAEAIAELLHRPLYSVSVGELGVNTTDLEKNLRQILDVAQIWNAVILIDEADIFLEKRGNDIVRTAMTSIMLRLLEYHQGVMFLTTNRVGEFDTAFYSRISVALKYQSLTDDAREQIWTNLLAAAKVTGLDPAELAKIKINGRQIKNTIRLAQGLASQSGIPVNTQHIMQCLDISVQFLEDMKSSNY